MNRFKHFIFIVISLFSMVNCVAQNKQTPKLTEYEMKTYFMVFLLKGPNRSETDTSYVNKIQSQHLAHIDKLYKEGKICMAGPFLDDADSRGILVFNVPTMEEAKTLAEQDPAVKAGRLKVEVRPWMSAKGSKLE